MDRAEPAFKPEWLKSSSNGNSNHFGSNHHVGTSPHSDEQHGVGISPRTGLLSSSRRSLSSTISKIPDSKIPDSRIPDSNSGKSRAYSSFGSCRRERDRVRDYDLQREKRVSDSDFDNPLRRSRSMVQNRDFNSSTRNGTARTGISIPGSFEKEFPSLGPDPGFQLTGRVSSPGVNVGNVSINRVLESIGGESWNSVLVDVPVLSSNGSNGSSGSNGSGGSGAGQTGLGVSGPVSPAPLNMAEAVAQAPSRVRTPPQLTADTQKIEERTLKQFKQLIPVTPSMPKSSVSSSLDKLKPKTLNPKPDSILHTPKSLQPLSSSHQPVSPAVTSKPQIGNFQVLNRDKTVISPNPPPVISTKPAGPVPSAAPLKSPTKRAQSKDKMEFFRFIRNQSLGASSPPDQDKEAKEQDKEQQQVFEGLEKKLVIANPGLNGETGQDGEMGLKGEVGLNGGTGETGQNGEMELNPDPEEEAFLLSLGWDQNAEVDELTKEEIEAFINKYKEVKQSA